MRVDRQIADDIKNTRNVNGDAFGEFFLFLLGNGALELHDGFIGGDFDVLELVVGVPSQFVVDASRKGAVIDVLRRGAVTH